MLTIKDLDEDTRLIVGVRGECLDGTEDVHSGDSPGILGGLMLGGVKVSWYSADSISNGVFEVRSPWYSIPNRSSSIIGRCSLSEAKTHDGVVELS